MIQDQPAPHGYGKDICPLVINDIKDRMKIGEKRYGESLKAFNGRRPLIDLYQELLDACMYIRQLIEEEENG